MVVFSGGSLLGEPDRVAYFHFAESEGRVMQILSMKENEDGSATVEFDMTADEVASLIQSAVIIGITEGLKLVEKERMKECQDLAQSTSNT